MTEVTGTRHIVPCRHRGAQKRIYVVWNGEGDGSAQLDLAMRRFGETEFDASATPAEHFRNIADFLKRAGFEEIKS